jgi:hypothetical protein
MKNFSAVLTFSLIGGAMIGLACSPLAGQSNYSDPQSRFTLTVPAGWNPSNANDSLMLTRGDALSVIMPLPSGNADEILSSLVKQVGSQTHDLRPVGTQQQSVGGQPAAFQGFVGVNPKGVRVFYGLYGVVANGQGYGIFQSGPMSEFSVLAGDMDSIVHSISFGGAGSRNGNYRNPGSGSPQDGQSGPDRSAPRSDGSMFQSQDHSVSFPTPAGWTVRTLDAGGMPLYVLDREGGQERILVASGAAAGSIQEIAQQGMQLVTQQMPALRPVSAPRFSQINGAPLATISYAGNAQGTEVKGVHLITLQNGQYFGALGLADTNNSQMVQDACQAIVGGARLSRVQQSRGPGNVAGLVGSWIYYKSSQMGCSTDRNLTIYANGRYEYTTSAYCPNIAPGIDPTSHISGTYTVSGNTIVGRTDNGQTETFTYQLLQGGQILQIGSDQYFRK